MYFAKSGEEQHVLFFFFLPLKYTCLCITYAILLLEVFANHLNKLLRLNIKLMFTLTIYAIDMNDTYYMSDICAITLVSD